MPDAIFDEPFWSAVAKFQRGGSGIKREDEVERIVEFDSPAYFKVYKNFVCPVHVLTRNIPFIDGLKRNQIAVKLKR